MDPVTAGALISAGSSLVGNLIGGKPKYESTGDVIKAKMKSAERYGISKLAMLGAPIQSGAMISAGDTGLGSTIANMGADIGRSYAAQQTDAERLLQKLTLEKAGLENDYLRSQIASINGRTVRESAPSVPVVNGLVPDRVVPPQRTSGLNVGVGYPTHPKFVDSQAFTDRYGESELLELMTAIINGDADLQSASPNWGSPNAAGRTVRRYIGDFFR